MFKNLKTKSAILITCIILLTLITFMQRTNRPQKLNRSPFIYTNGQQLMLQDQIFEPKGVNFYDLAYKNNDLIARTFSQLHKAGVTTIRFWLFGDGDPNGFQPTAGIYNDMRFKQVDYMLVEAKKNNIKLIPVLTNNWPDFGGKNKYIEWQGHNPEKDEKIFYTDKSIKSTFEKYITYILSRKNTFTGTRYIDDPTILGWDIMNEPRGQDQNAKNIWLISIASFIKQHDHNHLVFAGTEISYAPSQKQSPALCENSAIDICSVHLYLFDDKTPLYAKYEDIQTFLQTQTDYAEKIKKPLFLEEFGIPSDTKPFNKDPLYIMKQVINNMNQENIAGLLIWDWADTQYTTFTFTPTGDSQGNYSLLDLEHLLTK